MIKAGIANIAIESSKHVTKNDLRIFNYILKCMHPMYLRIYKFNDFVERHHSDRLDYTAKVTYVYIEYLIEYVRLEPDMDHLLIFMSGNFSDHYWDRIKFLKFPVIAIQLPFCRRSKTSFLPHWIRTIELDPKACRNILADQYVDHITSEQNNDHALNNSWLTPTTHTFTYDATSSQTASTDIFSNLSGS